MKKLLLGTCILIALHAQAQDTAKAPVYGWKHGAVAGLTLTQVAFTDWAQGGDNALAYALSLQGKSVEEQPLTEWANSYKFGYGQARLGDQGIRKTDDRIELETLLTYKLNLYVNPYAAATFKSQFTKGYVYPGGIETAVSKFFDPAYLTQSVGFGYTPTTGVRTRLGFGLREIITSDFNQYASDPPPAAASKTRIDGGMESVTDAEWKLDDNILFTSKLELFAPFKSMDQIVVRSDNTISAKVSKYITTILNVQFINEKRISPRTQIKETIAVGLSYTLL